MDIYQLCEKINNRSPPQTKYRKWIIHMLNNWNNITDNEIIQFRELLDIPPECMCSCMRGAFLAVKIKEDYAIDSQENLEIHINIFHTREDEMLRAYII